jgi:hypothetical protein
MNWWLAAGSLAAVLMLAGIAWALRLGGENRIATPADASRIAEDWIAGFEAHDAVICSNGGGALVFGTRGSVALIRPSGARFIVREVRSPRWRSSESGLEFETGDRTLVRLYLPQAAAAALGARLDAAADNDVSNSRA